MIIKVATEQNDELQPLDNMQREAFESYIGKVKDAGVKVTVVSYPADELKLSIKIKRNPLILDNNGVGIINGGAPVNEAIKEYLRALPFNGELSLMKLIDAIQGVEGVEDLALQEVFTRHISGSDYSAWQGVYMSKIAESGYFKITNLTVDYE